MCHEREARNSCLESCAKISEFLLDSGFVHQVDKLTVLVEQSARGLHWRTPWEWYGHRLK